MNVKIESLPHKSQRYETCGDWFIDNDYANGALEIRVSKMDDWRHEFLIAVHEFIEAMLCKKAGVPEAMVDQFDMDFEKNRAQGDHSEPGDDPRAPYRKQHFIATNIERQLAAELGVDWQEYEKAIEKL